MTEHRPQGRPAVTDHFDGRRFFNPHAQGARSSWAVLRWILTRRRQPWPRGMDSPLEGKPPVPPEGQAAVTFVGHSTFLLQLGETNVLTDPVWSERASPVSWAGPRRVRPPAVALDALPPVHVVLVSHNHYDHMDLRTLRHLEWRFAPLFVTGLGNRRYLLGRGLRRVEELDWWHGLEAAGLTITMTPAQHFSRRGLFDTNRTLWGGFEVRRGGFRVLFAADSGYAPYFREVRERLGPPDVALLPIGAYEPRWIMGPVHLDPAEAVRAHLDLGARQSLAMHFGTFRLTDEGIDEPVHELRRALREADVPEEAFHVPGFGETLMVPMHGG
jgi:L-ascorbate metabolism protein UlaG (beta-lactamase superfamily)